MTAASSSGGHAVPDEIAEPRSVTGVAQPRDELAAARDCCGAAMKGARSSTGNVHRHYARRTRRAFRGRRAASFLYCSQPRSQGRHYVRNAHLVSRCRRVSDRRLLRHERAGLRHGRLAHGRVRGRHAWPLGGQRSAATATPAPITASRPISRAIVPGTPTACACTAARATASPWATAARRIKACAPPISKRRSSPSTTRAGSCNELESALASVDSRIATNYRAQENIKQELTDIAAKMIATRHDDRAARRDGHAQRGPRAPLRRAHDRDPASSSATERSPNARCRYRQSLRDYRAAVDFRLACRAR